MIPSYPKDSFSKKDRSDFPGCLAQNPTFHPIHLICFARSVGDGSSVSWSTPTPAGFGEKSLRPRISRAKVTILQKSREETRQMERGGAAQDILDPLLSHGEGWFPQGEIREAQQGSQLCLHLQDLGLLT